MSADYVLVSIPCTVECEEYFDHSVIKCDKCNTSGTLFVSRRHLSFADVSQVAWSSVESLESNQLCENIVAKIPIAKFHKKHTWTKNKTEELF